MAEPLKNYYNTDFFNFLNANLKDAWSEHNPKAFMKLVLDDEWDNRELKDRMRHIANCFHATLPGDYRNQLDILNKAIRSSDGEMYDFLQMCFPDFVEVYGQDDPEASIAALKHMTSVASAEFAIRPFIQQDAKKVMALLLKWTKDKNHHIRRLASEGCRSRLPWAMALPDFKKDPKLILPILEALKHDESEYVRRSVANNLNDISKDNPRTVLDIAKKWVGHNHDTDRLVKHALRTLLKQGNTEALMLFGFGDPSAIAVERLEVSNSTPKIGEDFHFSFDLSTQQKPLGKLRVEYLVYYMKANGTLSPKVFQLSEKEHSETAASYSKKHSFKQLSTRKHYAGTHKLAVSVNSVEKAFINFELTQ